MEAELLSVLSVQIERKKKMLLSVLQLGSGNDEQLHHD